VQDARVRETVAELESLQALLDASFASSGAHLREAFQQQKRPTAEQLVAALPDIFEMHLAVVGGGGAPLVAPIDGLLLHGRVWFGLPGGSVRAGIVRREPRVSASFVGEGIALIAHGTAVAADTGEFEDVCRDLYVARYGPAFLEWQAAHEAKPSQPGFSGYIEPRVMFATANG
jgi:hypothetical protein